MATTLPFFVIGAAVLLVVKEPRPTGPHVEEGGAPGS